MAEKRPSVVVFSPCPILTVTVEDAGGEDALHIHAGGQGVWVARMAATLGADVALCCSVGGETGEVMDVLLQRGNIRLVAGRSNDPNPGYVHDRRDGERTPIAATPGPKLTRHELDELYNIALAEGLAADVVVLTGQNEFATIPSEVYGRLAKDLSNNGVRTVADLEGADLAAVEHVNILKIAHGALLEDGDAASDSTEEFVRVLRDFGERKADNVVISRAEKPALALFGGEMFEVKAPSFEATEHRGAGDSMTAALAVAYARGEDREDVLRLAAAAGATNVTRRGLGSGDRASIEKIARAVRLQPLEIEEEQRPAKT